jgi:hypothetical protein
MQLFTKNQLNALENGKAIRDKFSNSVKVATKGDYTRLLKKHWYFSSMPGLVKTTTIKNLLDGCGLKHYIISGKKSMRDFGYQLAFIVDNHNFKKDGKVLIFIDDCEFLFQNNDNMNIFKNVIGKMRSFNYANNSALDGAKKLPKPMKDAVMKHRMNDAEGFSVPTDDVHFLIASNVKLPSEEEAAERQSRRPGPAADLMVSKAAISDRMNNHHIDFERWEDQWGYVASLIMKNPYFGDVDRIEFSEEERTQMVLWTWQNFDKIKSRSVRFYEGLAQEMLMYPDEYLDVWNSSKYLDISYNKK